MAGEPTSIMPGERAGIPEGYLDQFKNGTQAPSVTVDDINSYNYGLTPDQEEAYRASQEKYTPVKPVLNTQDYYPNQGDPIGVGQFSGSWRNGSINATQYAPNGALVPIGMWDARDAAIQKAAMMKAKDVDDWKRKNAQAPTSKLTNINDNIRQEFFKHQDTSWKKALQAAGGDANKAKFMLENDQNYQAKNKSFYDQAKMGDAIVAQDAQLEDDVRSGKKILTPDMIEARKRLHAATDPSTHEFKDFSNAYNSYVAVNEFNEAYNTVVDKMTREKLASAGISDSDPEYWTEYKTTKEFMREDQKQAIEDSLNKMYQGHGDSFYTPDHIHKQVWNRNSNVRQERDVNLQNKPKNPGEVEDLNVADISDEEGSLLGVVAGKGTDASGQYGTKDREGNFTQLDGLTFKKPVSVVIPASADVTDMTTGKKRTDKAVRQATVGGIYNAYTYNGQVVDDEFLKDPKKAKLVKVVPMAAVIFKEKNEEGKEVETSGQIPLEQIKNALRGKRNQNDKVLEEYDNRAKRRTEEVQGKGSGKITETESKGVGSANSYKVKGKEFSHSAIEKAAKASGMTIDEYLAEVNK